MFSGRISRSSYLIGLVLAFVAPFSVVWGVFPNNAGAVGIAFVIWTFAKLSLHVRRLHDIGWSGRWVLVELFPPVGLVLAFVLIFFPGMREGNRYGGPPGSWDIRGLIGLPLTHS
jgi:uncharacterized membrane protein YhaH (DUF805 family)